MKKINENRIVRVFNDDIHRMLSYVARLTKSPYQTVFSEFLDYVSEGHVVGDMTHHKLIERVLVEREKRQ